MGLLDANPGSYDWSDRSGSYPQQSQSATSYDWSAPSAPANVPNMPQGGSPYGYSSPYPQAPSGPPMPPSTAPMSQDASGGMSLPELLYQIAAQERIPPQRRGLTPQQQWLLRMRQMPRANPEVRKLDRSDYFPSASPPPTYYPNPQSRYGG